MFRQSLLKLGVLVLLLASVSFAQKYDNPRIAVIMSRDSFARQWDVTQMSAHAWVGIANLAGIPYDTLFLEDLAADQQLSRFSTLVFAQCTTIGPDSLTRLVPVLDRFVKQGGNLVIDGPLAGYNQEGKPQSPTALWTLLGVSSSGLHGDATFRIQVTDNGHYITRPFESSQYLSQSLARGLEIQQFASGGRVLATSTNARGSFPFLSYRNTGANRLVLISDATTFAGATSIFRNDAPQGFYANQVATLLIRALQWATYGDVQGAFPAPQFSNAPISVIVRLDADNTQNLDYQKQTFQFLFNTARQTGVVPLYCLVSSAGRQAGWKDLARLGQQLEDFGGQIGSHSRYHRIESRMGPDKYKEELDGSIEDIESNMTGNGAHIGKVDLFINPGDTIVNSDYEEVARRFQLMMTHGFEQDTPIGSGVMTWFTGPHKDFVVLDDTPSPDYQWFYDPAWSYTTAQITSYQEAVFDHLFTSVGRGYIYNQMWHDYSISSMPLRHEADDQQTATATKPARIANSSNLAMYEALTAKFATTPIYAPEPIEVAEKLRAMAGWNYSWSRLGETLNLALDLSTLPRRSTADFVGGMGIRIENTNSRIAAVTINGHPHDAFSDHVIILPNLPAGKNLISVKLSERTAETPHLAYVSVRMPYVKRTGNSIEFQLLTRSKGRFAINSAAPAVVLDADSQQFDVKGDGVLTGFVISDRVLHYLPLKRAGFSLRSATIPVSGLEETANGLRLHLEKTNTGKRELVFSSARPPKQIRWNEQLTQPTVSGSEYLIVLPEYQQPGFLEILW
jgi:hypothetical protein